MYNLKFIKMCFIRMSDLLKCKSFVVDLICLYDVVVVAFKLCHCIRIVKRRRLYPDKSNYDFSKGGCSLSSRI